MKVKKNDTVVVISGKDAGKTGKVLTAFPAENRVTVDGVNVQKKSKKARSAKETGGIIEQVGKINASNVLVICPACGKATRVHHNVVDGKKVRVCAKCGAALDKKAEAVKAEKTAKTTAKRAPRKKKADAE